LTASLVLFTYFQLLDLLTTVVFISQGIKEANPLVRFALTAAPTPLLGLVLIKAAALALAAYCCLQGRKKLLVRMNVFFAALVSWNLFALTVRAVETFRP
jgi:Domain of unknown function (DUF5658)